MYIDDAGAATAQQAATAVHTFWDDIKNLVSTAYTMQVEPEVASIDVATGKTTLVTTTSNALVTGNSSSAPLPWATQGLVRWSTGHFINGRQVRGHTFIPGPCVNDNSGGVPSSGYQGTLNSAAATLVGSAIVNFYIYSRKNLTGENVSGGSAWNKWAVLTSRRD